MLTVSWRGYPFGVYFKNTDWNEVGGVYIFCGLNPQKLWVPLYIGQADSFRSRIPSHVQWLPAVRLGATHVHAMVAPLASQRDIIEAQLIQAFQPALNVQLK